MDITPINQKRIYQSVVEQIIKLVRDGNLSEGQKLSSERELSRMFNVSRASLREALRALEIVGVLEVRTGEGAFVTSFNVVQFINTIAPLFVRDDGMENDLLEFRKLLETEAVKLAALHAPAEELSRLAERLFRMEQAVLADDTDAGVYEDVEFHKELFVLSGNRILQKAMECTAYLLESSVLYNRKHILENKKNSLVLLEQHRAIYDALVQRDPQRAEQIIVDHLDFVKTISRKMVKGLK